MPSKKEKLPLSVTHPELAKEIKKGDASLISAGSDRKFIWTCSQGHEWVASVGSRALRNTGCPFCAGTKILNGYNDLKTLFPEIAKQANGWDAGVVSPGSHQIAEWVCEFGHIWKAKIQSRVVTEGRKKADSEANGCPFCWGKKTWPGFNDLGTTHPKLTSFLLNPKDATTVSKGSAKKVRWKCKLEHEFLKSPSNIKGDDPGCPICHGVVVQVGFNDLKSQFPKIASELQDVNPESITFGSSKLLEWRCNLGHHWKARVGSRTFYNSSCPYCSETKILSGFNDLKTLFPEIASEIVGTDPTKYGRSSKTKVEWECKRQHRYISSISDRTLKGSGCPYCSGNLVLAGFNDLSSTHPLLAQEAYEWDPNEVSAGSGKLRNWICEFGHKWKASPQSRALHKTGCPYCSGNKVLKGFNDLETTHPEYAKQAFGWDPSTVTFGSRTRKTWKCQLSHQYSSTPNQRTSRGITVGCPYCHGTRVLVGFNDLATRYPEIAKQADGWDPKHYTSGSVSLLWWKCEFGHRWRATPNTRTSGRGCPSCALSGFDPNEKGYLYFLIHEDWGMYQIGITNVPKDRVGRHQKSGWQLQELRGPMDGHLTQQWETAILRMLKAKGADLSNEKIAGKFDGYSEAWSKSTFEVGSIGELMVLTERFEDNV